MNHHAFTHNRICSQCGQTKPLSAFLYSDNHGEHISYSILCSECRAIQPDDQASSSDQDEITTPKLNLKIDSNAKIYAAQENKKRNKLNKLLEKKEKTKKRLAENKKQKLIKASSSSPIKEPDQLSKQNQSRTFFTHSSEQDSMKSSLSQTNAISQESQKEKMNEENSKNTRDLFSGKNPHSSFMTSQIPGQVNRNSSQFLQFMQILPENAPAKQSIKALNRPTPSTLVKRIFNAASQPITQNVPENNHKPLFNPLPHKK